MKKVKEIANNAIEYVRGPKKDFENKNKMEVGIESEQIQKKSLFISAGHSNKDPGAIGHGYSEAEIVTEFRDLLASELRILGVEFSKDGERGENLPLGDAIQLAKSHDIAIEFHCNAFHLESANGVETLSSRDHYELCDSINLLISETLGIRNRGSKGESSGQHSRLGFINKANGIIVELFFITNRKDLDSYLENKEELAKQMALLLSNKYC